MSETQEPEPKPLSRWGYMTGWQQLLVTAVIAVVAIVVVAGILDRLGADSGGGPDERGARDVCQQFVEKRLKAPSTAEFGEATASVAGGQWTVRGDVDAENSFGAPIRNHFVCTVKPTDAAGDNWELVNVELDE